MLPPLPQSTLFPYTTLFRSGRHSLYHAGDTAYFAGFREIGRRLAPELALLPIGAYNPPQFRNVHADPSDATDRKSTRLNSSHVANSYAVFCLKKKISPSRMR